MTFESASIYHDYNDDDLLGFFKVLTSVIPMSVHSRDRGRIRAVTVLVTAYPTLFFYIY